jgi:hypothetical protein
LEGANHPEVEVAVGESTVRTQMILYMVIIVTADSMLYVLYCIVYCIQYIQRSKINEKKENLKFSNRGSLVFKKGKIMNYWLRSFFGKVCTRKWWDWHWLGTKPQAVSNFLGSVIDVAVIHKQKNGKAKTEDCGVFVLIWCRGVLFRGCADYVDTKFIILFVQEKFDKGNT